MIVKKFTVKFPNGLHARPAAYLAQKLKDFDLKEIVFECDSFKTKLGGTILELLSMNAAKGAVIKVQINGKDEKIVEEFLNNFFNTATEQDIYTNFTTF